MALNEQEILRGVNQKDLKAWETLYASYYAALCSYADGIVKERPKQIFVDITQ